MASLLTHTTASGREVALRITTPDVGGQHPVILFSHGHRYSHAHYLPLAEHWATNGFVVIQPRHQDAAELDTRYGGTGRPDELWRWRIEDLQAVLAGLDDLQVRHGEVAGRLDPERIVAVGHSFGAHTVQAFAGARVGDAKASFLDRRIRAVVLIAAPGAGADLSEAWAERTYLNVDWSGMHTLALVVAGDNDRPWPMSPRDWDWRLDPYEQSPSGGRHALVVAGADHFFGGIHNRPADPKPEEALQFALVRDAATAFLRTALEPADPAWSQARARLAANPSAVRSIVSK